ncbi:MAG: glycosyltransferase family 2 protein [Bacilli bacterium]|nr:glycosyltransferase family 2 protein [Bacilli bacterium]
MKNGMLIVNYNDYESTKKLLENIKDYKILDQVVIVDNHSTDDSLKLLKKLKDSKIIILEMKENRGYAAAINYGSRKLIEKLGACRIIVSNTDIVINKEKDLKNLLDLLKRKEIGVVGPTILEQGVLNRGWKNPTAWIDSLMNLPYIHRWIRKKFVKYKENHYQEKTSKVDVVSGCFFCISSSSLEKIDFLDENTFLYYEENILAKKLQNIGLSCVIDNNTLIFHNHSVTIDKSMSKIKKYRAQKKSQYYFHTTYQNANILEKLALKGTRGIAEVTLTIYYFFKDLAR